MPALPPITDFTAGSVSEGGFKTALTAMHSYLSTLLGLTGNQGPALTAIGAPFNTVSTKTGAYTVVATDRGKHLDLSGTFTLGFTAAATLGDGFSLSIRNSGAGAITVDPSASETLDGATTTVLAPGQSLVIVCDGSAFRSVGKTAPAGALLNVQVFLANGTYTATPGTTRIFVDILGPGGTGGSGANPAPGALNGQGPSGVGGEGGARRGLFTTNTASQTVTIGASGGTTSFGALVTALRRQAGSGGFTVTCGHAAVRLPLTDVGSSTAGPANSGAGGGGGTGGINDSYGILQVAATAGGAGGSGMVVVYEYA